MAKCDTPRYPVTNAEGINIERLSDERDPAQQSAWRNILVRMQRQRRDRRVTP